MTRLIVMLAMLLGLASIAPATVRHGAAHQSTRHVHDWSMVIAPTPDGGMRMGNPDARVKLVEYFSYTCPHCAAFSVEAMQPLVDGYVKGGQVSFELRSALRDRLDYLAAMLARCGGTHGYFPMTEAILAAQADWLPKAIAYDSEHPTDLQGPEAGVNGAAIVTQSGLDAIATKQGVATGLLPRCLADPATRKILEATTNDAWNVRKISGTPGFLINGAVQADVYGWPQLEPRLQAALKS